MKSNVVETITGAIVIAVAVVFFVFAYRIAGVGAAAGGYQVDAKFGRVSGLVTGADVRLSGIKIGTVIDQQLDKKTYDAIVTMQIAPDIELPVDTTAKIASEGLLGGSYIELAPGGAEEKMAAGDTIEFTQDSVSLMDMIGTAVFGGK